MRQRGGAPSRGEGDPDPMALLDRYTGPWTEKEAAHLARRAGFGATPAELTNLVAMGLDAAVSSFVDFSPNATAMEAILAALPNDTSDKGNLRNWTQRQHFEGWWLYRMAKTDQPMQEQLALFLHDTLVSDFPKTTTGFSSLINLGNDGSTPGQICTTGTLPPDSNRQRKETMRLLSNQLRLFRESGALSYRELVRSVTRDPAMLLYLDNYLNTKTKPQENYGREVMELFSMGVGNYSENDVKEVSKALTGETVVTSCALNFPYTHTFNAATHDTGTKTVFGVSFNNAAPGADTDFVIDLIFDRISGAAITPAHSTLPAASIYISWSLLRWFLNDGITLGDPAVVEAAAIFNATSTNGYRYDVRELLRTLLSSQVFYDPANYYNMVKRPPDFAVMALRSLAIDESSWSSGLPNAVTAMGMRLYGAPNVAGWDHGRAWIDSGTVRARFHYADRLSGSTRFTDAMCDALITNGFVASISDNAGIVEYFRARLIQEALRPEELAELSAFMTGVDAGAPSQSRFRRKVRGVLHLMMCLPRYQLK